MQYQNTAVSPTRTRQDRLDYLRSHFDSLLFKYSHYLCKNASQNTSSHLMFISMYKTPCMEWNIGGVTSAMPKPWHKMSHYNLLCYFCIYLYIFLQNIDCFCIYTQHRTSLWRCIKPLTSCHRWLVGYLWHGRWFTLYIPAVLYLILSVLGSKKKCLPGISASQDLFGPIRQSLRLV